MDDDLKRYLDAIQEQNAAAHEETRRHFDVAIGMLRNDSKASTETIKRHFDVTTETIKRHFDVTTETIKRHFDVATEAMSAQIRHIAEIIARLDEKFDTINATVERTAAETQAMIRF